jgi:NAD(P)-dependent dehydrogenase (short-subunit alcohol dehydrogenase family)
VSDHSEVPDYSTLLRLDGRGYVVLGAGQGIGRQTAHALASVGARVVCADVEADRAQRVAAETGGIAWTGDLTASTEIDRLAGDSEAALGRIDGFADIIGMARYGPLVDATDEDWEWTFDLVLRHAYRAARSFGSRMAASGGGTMAYVASASGIGGAAGHAAYGSAKAALISLVRSLAVELGGDGIRVNAVAPGVVWTPRVSELLGAEGRAVHATNAPLGRVALPADVASVLLFLSAPLSAYVSGQIILADGGVGQKFPYPGLW